MNANSRTAVKLLGVVAVMIGLTAAAVPAYNLFCRVTGFGGATVRNDVGSDIVTDELITIRFDANRAIGMPWEFRPAQQSMELRIGETGLAFYEAYNPTDHPIAGSAVFNVTPFITGGYFVKIDCFCFTEQVLMPGERVQMPVSFYVDPEILDDPEASLVPAITLSYTFHEIDIPEDYDLAALD
ncbi:cytochrome c oxidase assembly protein [Rhodobacterales bacterium HKCCE3408]|nr:cytochrome c oxidase assembly protein [Rhodobacterales bacterium HKCCE3408]